MRKTFVKCFLIMDHLFFIFIFSTIFQLNINSKQNIRGLDSNADLPLSEATTLPSVQVKMSSVNFELVITFSILPLSV